MAARGGLFDKNQVFAAIGAIRDISAPINFTGTDKARAGVNREAIDQATGAGIARGMIAHQAIADYNRGLDDKSAYYASLERRANGVTPKANRWYREQAYLSAQKDEMRNLAIEAGLTENDPRYALMQEKYGATVRQFQDAYSAQASSSYSDFMQSLGAMNGMSRNTATFAKNFATLGSQWSDAEGAHSLLFSDVANMIVAARSYLGDGAIPDITNLPGVSESVKRSLADMRDKRSQTPEGDEGLSQLNADIEHAELLQKRVGQLSLANEAQLAAGKRFTEVQAGMLSREVTSSLLGSDAFLAKTSGQGIGVGMRVKDALAREQEEAGMHLASIQELLTLEDDPDHQGQKRYKYFARQLSGTEEQRNAAGKQIEDLKARRDRLLGLDSTYWNARESMLSGEYSAQEQADILKMDHSMQQSALQGRRLNMNAWGMNRGLVGGAMSRYWGVREQFENRVYGLRSQIAEDDRIMSKEPKDSAKYQKASERKAFNVNQLKSAESGLKTFTGTFGKLSAVGTSIEQSFSRIFSRFGYQMFSKVTQEVTQFVKQFDKSMTEIQMVTQKTDSEINTLGANLIQTAIDMKVSVSDVTSAATELYRQGLDDNEVSVRMEDVLKFAKVANIKATDATKIITTAMSNGLVSSSEEAMDVLVALGDAAATSAQEIAKGMQKSAASAAQAGVSYEQLATMLTIITSKTQLGGNQAGTALQTLMYRMYRVSQGEDYYDENGKHVAANEAEEALNTLGVSIYDEDGNKRGAYDIMIDVAKHWNSADDIAQERVLNALGAGRQRSNIATLIQGLAEDDGALADKYMSLASGSSGITDDKYLSYLGSLEAASASLKSAFDGLVNSFQSSDSTTGVINWLADFVQNLTAAEESVNALSVVIGALTIALLG